MENGVVAWVGVACHQNLRLIGNTGRKAWKKAIDCHQRSHNHIDSANATTEPVANVVDRTHKRLIEIVAPLISATGKIGSHVLAQRGKGIAGDGHSVKTVNDLATKPVSESS